MTFRLLCKGTDCDGCHCHISPPCSHCVEHMHDGPLSRIFKDSDRWVAVCYLSGCERRYPITLAGGTLVYVSETFDPSMIYFIDYHVTLHLNGVI